MNILIPHTWLLEHLETAVTPQELQKLVSLSGPSIERIYDKNGESVYDIEVTTNRVDSMSVRGIAREAAVILSEAGKPSHLKAVARTFTAPRAATALPLPKITDAEHLCKRTLAVVLSSVSHAATPKWMADRLLQIDQNVHDAVIDITNYVTHELGHPCHAFDYDKIMRLGGEIIVKTASKGKKFTTLDGVEYITLGGEVVFENLQGEIIDFPAIKGTANTAVSATTQNILFWIESLPAEKVRFGSMSHAIRTVAAQLNEKNVDPTLAELVLYRAVELYVTLCGAEQASDVLDIFTDKPQPQPVHVPLSTFKRYLGITLPPEQITDILTKLECQVTSQDDSILVTPPTFRPDIQIPADVVEEIARIYGYHTLESKLMDTPIPTTYPAGVNIALEERTKRFLAALGLQEVYTYSLVSEGIALQSGFSVSEHLALQNPLTDDRVYLRRTLAPSLQEVCSTNPTRTGLSVFELAHLYQPRTGELPQQDLHLTLYLQKPYREARGILETYLKQILFLPTVTITPDSDTSATVGTLGNISVQPSGAVVIDLLWSEVVRQAQSHPHYEPQLKYPAVTEDLTITLPARTPIGSVLECIQKTDSLVRSVHFVEQYHDNVTVRVSYQDATRPLSSADVEPVRKKIVAELAHQYSGKLVGELA